MKITVPATSANIGPGFDSVGVAVSKYLTIEVLEPADAWHIEHDLGDIPSDENNLLISTALQVKSDLQPHKLVMTSDIPLARVSVLQVLLLSQESSWPINWQT